MTDPALSSARNHQGRPWFGPGAGTPVELRVGPSRNRTQFALRTSAAVECAVVLTASVDDDVGLSSRR